MGARPLARARASPPRSTLLLFCLLCFFPPFSLFPQAAGASHFSLLPHRVAFLLLVLALPLPTHTQSASALTRRGESKAAVAPPLASPTPALHAATARCVSRGASADGNRFNRDFFFQLHRNLPSRHDDAQQGATTIPSRARSAILPTGAKNLSTTQPFLFLLASSNELMAPMEAVNARRHRSRASAPHRARADVGLLARWRIGSRDSGAASQNLVASSRTKRRAGG